jgi:chemotaxis protein methyltransferase CheR
LRIEKEKRKMQPHELRFLSEFIRNKTGIDLKEDKLYLFEARLLPIAAKLGHKDLSAFVSELMLKNMNINQAMQQEIIEAMTTNESMFFRDNKPFEHLSNIILPELKQNNLGRPINIWCAACSSGQEPYSIAIVAEENKHLFFEQIKIVASDIDTQILNKAKAGLYNQFEVQRGLASNLMLKYFTQIGSNWQVNEVIKNYVNFTPHNLMNDASNLGRFQLVFCRYVLIYFDDATKLKVLNHIANVMDSGGYLILGGAETLPLSCTQFTPHPKERKILIKK